MKTIYVAFDGTEFSKEDECRKFETEYVNEIEEKWRKMSTSLDAYIVNYGYGYIDVVELNTEDDVRLFNTFYNMHQGDYYKYSEAGGRRATNDDIGDVMLVHFNDEGMYMDVMGTPKEYINYIKEHLKKYANYEFEEEEKTKWQRRSSIGTY